MNNQKDFLDSLQEAGIQSMEEIAQRLGFNLEGLDCLSTCKTCHSQIICCVGESTQVVCPACHGTSFNVEFLGEEPEILDEDEIVFAQGRQLFGADIRLIKLLLIEMGKNK